jgi:hypothetical protein
MKNRIPFFARAIIVPVACFTLVSSPALATDSIPYANSGEWAIKIDTSLGGCFMLGTWERGTAVRIGINRNEKNGYLMLADPKWQSLRLGNKYKLKFQFDDETPWEGISTARKIGDTTVLHGTFGDGKFLREFAAKQGFRIYYEGNTVAQLRLTGSLAAMQTVYQCQQKVDAVLTRNSDPFARGNDPFANGGKPPLDLKRPDDPFAGSGGQRNGEQAESF